jgi:hypothetical protein
MARLIDEAEEFLARFADEAGHAALKRLRRPIAKQWLGRGRKYLPAATPDPMMIDEAMRTRATLGLSEAAFERNVAAARVRVGSEVVYLSAVNKAGQLQHSEGLLLEKLERLRERSKGSAFTIEQFYTERAPCFTCDQHLLGKFYGQALSEVPLFYTIERSTKDRAKALMKAYGL